ncbi:MAG: ferritin family protein [Kiritimatiellia bacterium]
MDPVTLHTPEQILRAALAREKQAHDFYENMALHCKVELVRRLLDDLKNEESRHIRLIQALLAKMELG